MGDAQEGVPDGFLEGGAFGGDGEGVGLIVEDLIEDGLGGGVIVPGVRGQGGGMAIVFEEVEGTDDVISGGDADAAQGCGGNAPGEVGLGGLGEVVEPVDGVVWEGEC